MSFKNNLKSMLQPASQLSNNQFQPKFPLGYDKSRGPYASVTDPIESIQVDFENILKTSPGEWPHNPDLGVGLRRYLFERYNSPKLQELEPSIRSQLERFLPQVQLVSVEFLASEQDKDESFTVININYTIMREAQVTTSVRVLSPAGKLKLNTNFHRGLLSSGRVYDVNNLNNDVVTI